MDEDSNTLSVADQRQVTSEVTSLFRSEIEQRLGEIECWAIDYLKPLVEETGAGAADTHILDLGDGVRIYRLKPDVHNIAELAIAAIHKCKLWESEFESLHLDARTQALFELGSIHERFVRGRRHGGEICQDKDVTANPKADDTSTRGGNPLRRLKRQAAEQAITQALADNGPHDERQAIIQAANELNISPRTLRKWRQFDT